MIRKLTPRMRAAAQRVIDSPESSFIATAAALAKLESEGMTPDMAYLMGYAQGRLDEREIPGIQALRDALETS